MKRNVAHETLCLRPFHRNGPNHSRDWEAPVTTMRSPGSGVPPLRTRANMPSRGMTQSPAWWKMAHPSQYGSRQPMLWWFARAFSSILKAVSDFHWKTDAFSPFPASRSTAMPLATAQTCLRNTTHCERMQTFSAPRPGPGLGIHHFRKR